MKPHPKRKRTFKRKVIPALIAACGMTATFQGPLAQVADLADVPLANSPSDAVLPNLMYILDDSGSMMWDYMPDYIYSGPGAGSGTKEHCKTLSNVSAAGASVNIASVVCMDGSTPSDWGEPPYYAAQFNQIYYNPDVSYEPGLDSNGVSLGAANPAAAIQDKYLNASTKNLKTTYPEIYYCLSSSGYTLGNTASCLRNGINNKDATYGYFLYWSNSTTNGGLPYGSSTANAFRNQVVSNTGNPYYFTITPNEWCTDENLVECALANADGSAPSGYTFPAPVRFCSGTANAAAATAVSDSALSTTPKCQATFRVGTYEYARYGRFKRTDITSSTATYAKSATAVRSDCANATYCTYDEELQNFANWYTYYRTRMAMMKTATGRAFRTIDDRYRVGFITINPGSPVKDPVNYPSDIRYIPIATFDATQKASFYSALYAQNNHGSTPLREALARVGRHYAGITSGINGGMNEDPMQYSCQQNFALLTTDGYWNDSTTGSAITTTNSLVGNPDGTTSTGTPVYVSRPTGTLDGTGSGTVTSTPFLEKEQVICQGSSTITSWTTGGNSGANTTACSCSGSLKMVMERTRNLSYDVTVVDGQTTSSTTNVTSVSFAAITACDAHVETTSAPYTETQEKVVSSSATTSFTSLITGVGNGEQTKGQCSGSSKKKSIVRRVRTGELITTTTDGSPSSTFSTSSVTFTQVYACTSSGGTLGASSLVTGASTTSSNSGTTITPAAYTLAPTNPVVTPNGAATTSTTTGGVANTLADVAMWYYMNDLRTSGPVATNNVPTTDRDVAPHQHMVTFSLGLGLKGLMNYRADYESATAGDFAKIKNGDTGCSWNSVSGQTCNWPAPVSSSPTTLDDLWHAAVNGRGVFYSAGNPNSLADGLAGALSALKVQTAAASASATSSPNITETDNFIYSSTFRTVKWDGQITAQRIDTNTGNVLPAVVWEAQALLDAKITSSTTDTRMIWKFDSTAPNQLESFTWANLSSASAGCSLTGEQACFANKGLDLSQYALLNAAQQVLADDGQNMVAWLRGQTRWEGADLAIEAIYRDREHVLGDAVNATPAYVRGANFNFNDAVTPTYADFKTAQTSRQGVLYIAANDGYLHAFNGDTGQELWAYAPRIIFPNLHRLATDSWDTTHRYMVDGSPSVMDVFKADSPSATTGAWKTILVGGLNKGGRGFYALDVTDPANPVGLWEICSDSSLCAVSDSDIGYSYGNAVIAKRAFDGRWVVVITSGINNISPGTGHGYLYVLDAFTGQVLQKVDTGAGDTTTPSGFSKISAFADNFNIDNTATFIYGGDLLGNVFRFDMSTDPPTVTTLGQLVDGSGRPQSITSRPELGVVEGNRVLFIGTGRYLGTDDLVDPATLSPAQSFAYQQSFYAFKDKVYGGSIRASSPGLVQQTLIDNVTSRSTSNNAVDWTNKDGWFVDFNPGNTSPGERVNLDPQLVLGTVVVVSNVPNNNACTVGGDSFIYQFNYGSGTYIASAPSQQVAQKFTGQITVGLVVVRLPSGVFKGVATGATGTKTPVGVNIGGGGGTGRRVSWRELMK